MNHIYMEHGKKDAFSAGEIGDKEAGSEEGRASGRASCTDVSSTGLHRGTVLHTSLADSKGSHFYKRLKFVST